ncbi:NTR domain-containing protein-like [Mytilus edulis]|uniref:NTR domain-containing protein-like n=1 Tax=Mytilus edulis TaxID=6550 RepID=UPI0039F08012
MKPTIFIIFCVVLINIISVAYGRCQKCRKYETKERKFCRATFVIRGKETGGRTLPEFQHKKEEAEFQVYANYKKKVPNVMKVRTDRDACGFSFQKGVEYLMSGTIRRSRYGVIYETNSCLWNDKWQNIKYGTQRKLKSGWFAKKCD